MRADHDEMKRLVASYVLGAIPEDEAGALRAHILSCDECLAEAESLAGVTSSLALAVEPEPLPEGFADRVMARVEAQRPVAVRRPSRFRRLAPVLAYASLVLLVAILGAAWLSARSDLMKRDEVVAALLSRSGMELTGEGEAVAKMVPTNDGAVFAARDLGGAPEGRTYQLWLMRGNCDGASQGPCKSVSVATFEGGDPVIIETSLEPERFDRAAVTVENDGGSDSPTTDPILVSS